MRFEVGAEDDGTGLRLRFYMPGDEFKVAARADFAQAFSEAAQELPEGYRYTMLDADQVLGVGGLVESHAARWQAWAYMGALRPRQWLVAAEFARIIVAAADQGYAEGGVIYAIPADTGGARRLLKRIGFAETGEHWVWRAA